VAEIHRLIDDLRQVVPVRQTGKLDSFNLGRSDGRFQQCDPRRWTHDHYY